MMQGPFIRNGKTLLSGVDPIRRADRAADAVEIKDKTLYFCPSPLFGYGLERFLLRIEAGAPDSAVICIEADPELYEIAINNIPAEIAQNKKLYITNICDAPQLISVIRAKWGARRFRRIETVRLNGGWQLFDGLYNSLCDTLRREFANDWSNVLTLTKLGRLYIRNFIRNFALLRQLPSVSRLSYGDEPVLVLGAGPSLDETLDAMAQTSALAELFACPPKRSFKIICADTCLNALKERNIVPDLAVILESQHWNIRDFLGCRNWKIPAAIDLSALPASAHLLAGDSYVFFTPWTPLKIFERLKNAGFLPAAFPPLGSVGLTAVELARKLTSGKVICAGLDFSFTYDKYHARSTPGHNSRLKSQNRFNGLLNKTAYDGVSISVVSKSGGFVRTSPIMKHYRNLFEQEFAQDERVYDIEGGALALGVKTLSNEEVRSILLLRRHADAKGDISINNAAPLRLCEGSCLDLFVSNESARLEELKNILTGEAQPDRERLGVLLSECDYLWAHFPDYAGGRLPGTEDISFLKRVRTEIDPMLRLFAKD